MSQRFIRCPHCGIPHDGAQVYCTETGKPLRGKSRKSDGGVQAVRSSQAIPAAPRVSSAPAPPLPSAPKIPAAPPSSRKEASRALPGKMIGDRYLVRSVLGEGGMGTVFEAEHLALGRSVAVKVLHATQATRKDSIRRFQQEARAAGAIGHPNICGVIDMGALDDGSPYIVMERLVGETLADRVASEGGLPFEDVIDIHVQVLSGLIAAHEQSIVHRDIKPENVFLVQRVGCAPLVKLLDFGVSKVMAGAAKQDDLDLTRTGMVMGTPYYMAPEQARGERDLDARVDLYACGVMLYEALTGKRPFTALNYNALLVNILSGTPRPPNELRPALPASYCAVIEKAMAKRREDRYGTAAAFQRDLQALRDRHNASLGVALEVGRVSRVVPAAGPERRPPSTPSSSVEIPITESTLPGELASELDDASGGLYAGEPTEVFARPPESKPEVAGDDGDDPTQLMARAKPRRR